MARAAVLLSVLAPSSASASEPALRPMVVYLHGCNQTAADAAGGTRGRELGGPRHRDGLPPAGPAPRRDAVLELVLEEHQHRGAGEPDMIVKAVRRTMAAERVDPARVCIAGASAGPSPSTATPTRPAPT